MMGNGHLVEKLDKGSRRERVSAWAPWLAIITFAVLSPLCWHVRSPSYFVHEAAALIFLFAILFFLLLCVWVALGRWHLAIAGLALATTCGGAFLAASWNVGEVMELNYVYNAHPSSSGKRMAILGFFCYPNPKHTGLRSFMETLRAAGSQAEVFIFCDQSPAEYEAEAKLLGFTLVSFKWKQPIHSALYAFSSLRFRLYLRLLQELHGQFAAVMICDIRDVFFQGDPQTLMVSSNASMVFAGENQVLQLPGLNAQWITQCFGHSALARIKGRQVSCSGTILGTQEAMQRYVQQHIAATGINPFCASQGVDQGVHNMLAWTAGFNSRVEDWRCGRILTVEKAEAVPARAGKLLNCHGEPYTIVHQWNRCKDPPQPRPTLSNATGRSCKHFPPPVGQGPIARSPTQP